jgi:DNA-binding XRE family transcriptional regulator
MTSKQGTIDINKVESLRTAMMLTNAQMASLFGVSRITYYNWRKGSGIARDSEHAAKAVIRKLAGLYVSGAWSIPDVRVMTNKKRYAHLLSLLADPEEEKKEVLQSGDGAPA